MAEKQVQLHKKNDTSEKWFPNTKSGYVGMNVSYPSIDPQNDKEITTTHDLNEFAGAVYNNILRRVTTSSNVRDIDTIITNSCNSNRVGSIGRTINDKIVSVYRVAGSINTSEKPLTNSNLDSNHVGYVYDLADDFSITSSNKDWFIEGDSLPSTLKKGTNIVVRQDDVSSSQYKYDVLGMPISGGGGQGTVDTGVSDQLAVYTASTTVAGASGLTYGSNVLSNSDSSNTSARKFLVENKYGGVSLQASYSTSEAGCRKGVYDESYGKWMIARRGNSLHLAEDCNIGIGVSINTAPSAKLHVVGDIYATGGVTAMYSSSDKRLKENIRPFNAMDIVDKLNPVQFNWNDTAKELSEEFGGETNYGLIAQEADGVVDNLVFDMPTGYKGVRYEKLIPILLEAVKEQQKEIEELKGRIVELENK